MKRLLLSLISMLVIGSAWAETTLEGVSFSADAVTGYKGATATLNINLSSTLLISGYQFALVLPDGVTIPTHKETVVKDGEEVEIDVYNYTNTERQNGFTVSGNYVDGRYRFLAANYAGGTVVKGEGCIVKLPLIISNDAEVGTYDLVFSQLDDPSLTGECNVSFSNESYNVPFTGTTLTIKEMETVTLYETSTTVPSATTDPVIAVVKRTINANEWSTICLPFAMDADQVEAAFGDAEIANLTGAEISSEGIILTFTKLTDRIIEPNHPYVVRLTSALSEFTVKGVTISPETNISNRRVQISIEDEETGDNTTFSFIGVYNVTTLNNLASYDKYFISNNLFWKSNNTSSMKGYRGYFQLPKISASSSKIGFMIDGETTSISDITADDVSALGGVYNINGMLIGKNVDVKKLPEGVYIVDGKKVTVK